ncbi:MAG: FtsX-like permease family protein, partial [Deltaproteobacteria bacterium]|nr:FtsX-like permease family protein [Deltaproteobacteria bacterium]
VLLAGVDFNSAKYLKPWWNIQGTVPKGNQVLLGSEAAIALGREVGGSLDINGRQFQVSGVLKPTGSQDDQLMFTRLSTAQAVLDKEGRISMVEVAALCKDCPIEEMVSQISSALPGAKVMAIQQVVKGRMETLNQFRRFSYGVSAVIVLVGGLVVLVTMMGSVRERTEEIGIFRAIGFRRSHIVRIVLLEAAIVSGLAGIAGYLLGLGAAKIALSFFSQSEGISVPLTLELSAGAIIMAVLIGLLSSAYPALMAARLDPNQALRTL